MLAINTHTHTLALAFAPNSLTELLLPMSCQQKLVVRPFYGNEDEKAPQWLRRVATGVAVT